MAPPELELLDDDEELELLLDELLELDDELEEELELEEEDDELEELLLELGVMTLMVELFALTLLAAS